MTWTIALTIFIFCLNSYIWFQVGRAKGCLELAIKVGLILREQGDIKAAEEVEELVRLWKTNK